MTADDIKALVERLHAAAPLAANGHVLTEAADALETLTLENQRLRVDAERYRWLRDWNKTSGWSEAGIDRQIAIDAALEQIAMRKV
ncbi:hypothetical protein [Paraburkholderia phenazinium]|uniref:Uncharacterized protein n=1 Tax=Paraburkholderia phenazinium TaxID=60549 RepID=A0A1N6KP19_9BURK|nr:hypothetical protein [Paraburkholderia phenazinium]SIO58288.1 hypothetical protein SAMN05444165_4089 [Paraburkholderia phenazinium]